MKIHAVILFLIQVFVCFICHAQSLAKQNEASTRKNRDHQFASGSSNLASLMWVIKLNASITENSQHVADGLASDLGLINAGAIFQQDLYYLFSHPFFHKQVTSNRTILSPSSKQVLNLAGWNIWQLDTVEWNLIKHSIETTMDHSSLIEWYQSQVIRSRLRRSLQFEDPAYPKQWHLHNDKVDGLDLNIWRVWERNVTGRGIITAVIDDGVQWNNSDLISNYYAAGSWDFNDNDQDPTPDNHIDFYHHGTRCAGEIAAAANDICGIGVAYEAKVAGIKVLGGPMTDSMEAMAFTKSMEEVDIYSCSWGPDDDGRTIDGPHYLARKALQKAVDYGRNGYGNIFVVASGNGGNNNDNCNFDGYATSIYTVTIGAVDEMGNTPYYAEECASMLAVTFSSSSGNHRDIVTTDWTLSPGSSGCTEHHTGTSAAAPLAAGMIALMLQARPCLTWRDVQHIIVMAAVKVDIEFAHWTQNSAGLHHSAKHGFGLMDAWRLVNAAKIWQQVPWMTSYTTSKQHVNTVIKGKRTATHSITVTKTDLIGYQLNSLEHVLVTLTLEHQHRGHVEVILTCPSGMNSTLAALRARDNGTDGFLYWTFGTVRCWGEPPDGTYVLSTTDHGDSTSRGILKWWRLRLTGSSMTTQDFKNRLKQVEDSYSGNFLFDDVKFDCPPPPPRNKPTKSMPEKTLKFLFISGLFFLIFAIYETFEYMFCFNEEKEEHKKVMRMRFRELANTEGYSLAQSSADGRGEYSQLLDDDLNQGDYTQPSNEIIEMCSMEVHADSDEVVEECDTTASSQDHYNR